MQYTIKIEINILYLIVYNILSIMSKYAKTSHVFFLVNGQIAKYTKDMEIKTYFDLTYFPKVKRQEIINILNIHYNDLIIIRKPSTNDLIFQIKGHEFIKRVWHKYEQKFYPIINENINFLNPTNF